MKKMNSDDYYKEDTVHSIFNREKDIIDYITNKDDYITVACCNGYYDVLASSDCAKIINTLVKGKTYTFVYDKNKLLKHVGESKKYTMTCMIKGFQLLNSGRHPAIYYESNHFDNYRCCLITSHHDNLFIKKSMIDNLKIDETYNLTCEYIYILNSKILEVCTYEKV